MNCTIRGEWIEKRSRGSNDREDAPTSSHYGSPTGRGVTNAIYNYKSYIPLGSCAIVVGIILYIYIHVSLLAARNSMSLTSIARLWFTLTLFACLCNVSVKVLVTSWSYTHVHAYTTYTRARARAQRADRPPRLRWSPCVRTRRISWNFLPAVAKNFGCGVITAQLRW